MNNENSKLELMLLSSPVIILGTGIKRVTSVFTFSVDLLHLFKVMSNFFSLTTSVLYV